MSEVSNNTGTFIYSSLRQGELFPEKSCTQVTLKLKMYKRLIISHEAIITGSRSLV